MAREERELLAKRIWKVQDEIGRCQNAWTVQQAFWNRMVDRAATEEKKTRFRDELDSLGEEYRITLRKLKARLKKLQIKMAVSTDRGYDGIQADDQEDHLQSADEILQGRFVLDEPE